MRPSFIISAFSGTIILIATICVVYSTNIPLSVVSIFLDMTGACMSFIIGERMYLAIKR